MFRFLPLVFLGGFLGASSRAGLAWLFPLSPFPWATFFVNAAGSIAIASLYLKLSSKTPPTTPWIQAFWMTGFCGSFTTVSLFQWELFSLVQNNSFKIAIAYLFLTLSSTFLPAAILLKRARSISS